MNDRELRHALRDLPRHRASDGFTRRTLARIEEGPAHGAADGPRRPMTWTLGRAAAAAALLGTAIGLLTLVPGPDQRSGGEGRTADHRAALRELRAERDRLADELDELKRQLGTAAPAAGSAARPEPTAGDPVLYLGGDDRIDLVLDLGRLASERGGEVVPTSARRGSS
jgi:hypothetical protein